MVPCNSQHRLHNCSKSKENKTNLEDLIFQETIKFVLSDEALQELATNLFNFYQSNEIKTELNKLEKEIKNIDNKQSNIAKLLIDFYDNEDLKAKLKEESKK